MENILKKIQNEKFIILINKEHEGHLVMPAQFISEKDIIFALKFGSGIFNVSIPDSEYYISSVDYYTNNDGINALDRSTTIKQLAFDNNRKHYKSPGNTFIYPAMVNGVLDKMEINEAVIDLCRLANLKPIGFSIKLLNHENGRIMKRNDCQKFSKEHDIEIIDINDIFEYRKNNTGLIKLQYETIVKHNNIEFKSIIFYSNVDNSFHTVLIKDSIKDIMLVSVDNNIDNKTLKNIIKKIGEEGGIIFYGNNYKTFIEILKFFGIKKINLISNNDSKYFEEYINKIVYIKKEKSSFLEILVRIFYYYFY